VGGRGAAGALDRGWEATGAAVDGDRGSGGALARVLERRKKGEAMRCSGVCKRS
jgi:hypothetical protein